MRPKWPPLDTDAELLELDLDVVMQQFQARLLFDTHPYDTSPPKVRECADSTERHDQLPVATGDAGSRGLEVINAIVWLLAKEFERQMQSRFVDPGGGGCALSQHGRRGRDLPPHERREVNRQKQSHRRARLR